jgi:membrane-bound serine protease (ClpP class)
LDGRITETPQGRVQLSLRNAPVRAIETSFLKKLLTIITHPDIAFILLSIGGLGIVIELYNPGAILPGVVGAISLILAFYSFQTLPINWAGVLLIALSIVLFIAEIKVVSFGLLTVGGVVSLVLGGMMLIDTLDPALKVSTGALTSVAVIAITFLLLLGWVVAKSTRLKVSTGPEALLGKVGPIRGNGFVFIEGALWRYRASETLSSGTMVRVDKIDGLTLIVSPVEKG